MLDLDSLTFGQLKEINAIFGSGNFNNNGSANTKIHPMIGKKVIIRTYSAGVWFGELVQKEKNEVILKNARRMFQWFCKESISLSAVAVYGINQDKSKICVPVDTVWLEAIELLPCSEISIESIENAKIVQQD